MWKQLSVVTYGMLDALLMFIGIKCIMISILEWLVVIDKWGEFWGRERERAIASQSVAEEKYDK